jgi:hypothetical protein
MPEAQGIQYADIGEVRMETRVSDQAVGGLCPGEEARVSQAV